jgi:hypothetical protein
MEAHRCVEFTDVELAGGTKIAALVKKATTSLVEKAAVGRSCGEDGPRWAAKVGRRCHGEEERQAAALGCGGDAGQRPEPERREER